MLSGIQEAQSKPDRLSTLISRFQVHARVHPYRDEPLYAVEDGKAQTRAANDAASDAANDDQVSGGRISGDPINFFIAQRGQMRSLMPEFSGFSEDFELSDDVPLLVFYPRGTPTRGTPTREMAKDLACFPLQQSTKAQGRDIQGRDIQERDIHGQDIQGQTNRGYVCAAVDMGGAENPIALALPDQVIVRLDQSRPLQAVTDILLEEACAPRCGSQAVIDRLCEIVVIRLLRHLIKGGQAEIGLLAGLANPNLSLAIIAIHDNPERNFNLEDLAEIAAMSRTHFVNSFRKAVGVTPGQYLSNWRLTLARMEIANGTPLKVIARQIGFSSTAALSRAFTRRYGISPRTEMMRTEMAQKEIVQR